MSREPAESNSSKGATPLAEAEESLSLLKRVEKKFSKESLSASGKSLFNHTIGYIASTRALEIGSPAPSNQKTTLEGAKPQRIPLQARRMGEYAFRTESTGNGGVTATPNTGQIPKVVPLNGTASPEETSTESEEKPQIARKKTAKPSNIRLWIPIQHGAYPMLLIPFWTGVGLSAFSYVHMVLFLFWILGFFAFHAISTWLKSGRKERYFPPVKFYSLAVMILGIMVIFLTPPLISWGIFFAPLLALGFWQAWLKKDTSLLARSTSVIAAGLMLLVCYDVGVNFRHPFQFWLDPNRVAEAVTPVISPFQVLSGWAWAAMVAWCFTAYYWSTVFYVKALVRKRKSVLFYRVHVAFHALVFLSMLVAKYWSWIGWGTTIFWAFLLFRAIAMPWWNQRRSQPFTVKQIGVQEVFVALLQLGLIFV